MTVQIERAVHAALERLIEDEVEAVQPGQGDERELLVYCAAGVKKAVEEIAGKFEKETGVSVVLEYASSEIGRAHV